LRKLVTLLLVSFSLMLGSPVAAGTSCDAERLLAAVGVSYEQLIGEDKEDRLRGAYHLKSLVPSLHPGWLAMQLKGDSAIEPELLGLYLMQIEAHSDAAIDGITFVPLQNDGLAFLERIANGPCGSETSESLNLLAAAGAGQANTGQADTGQAGAGTNSDTGSGNGKPALGQGDGISALAAMLIEPNKGAILRWLVIAGGVVGGAFGANFLFRSTAFFRQGREKRHPRKPFTAQFGVRLGDEEAQASGVDISVRGMKFALNLEEDQTPELGLPMKLLLPIGELGATLVWSNAHFAGVVFDRRLEDSEFASLLGHDSTTSAVNI